MKPSYSLVLRYHVTATCETPLRVSGSDNDCSTILVDSDGKPYIQGSSIAGVLRNFLESSRYSQSSGELFGTQANAGRLVVSDGCFGDNFAIHSRPRLRIDRNTGASAGKAKFDVKHIGKGSVFDFELTWFGNEQNRDKDKNIIEYMLAAINCGYVTFGAQRSNGFGQVSIEVSRTQYNLYNAEDLAAWIENARKSDRVVLESDIYSAGYVTFYVAAHTERLLIKASAAENVRGKKITRNISEKTFANATEFVIPGSSVKGTVRSRAESIASYMELPADVVNDLFGCSAVNSEDGSIKSGSVRFFDVFIPESQAKRRIVTRIKIDRFTGGVYEQALFSEEPISCDFTIRINVSAGNEAGCALLLFALRDFGLGLANIGSGFAIGQGYVDIKNITVRSDDGCVAVLAFDEDRNYTVDDRSHIINRWVNALGELTNEN